MSRQPNLKQQLAALILQHFEIPHEIGATMTVAEILSMVDRDHYPVAYATARDLGWTPSEINHPSNIWFRLSPEHDIKSATIDVPQIARDERLSASAKEFRRRILAKTGQADAVQVKQSKLRGRGFEKSKKVKTPRFVPPT